jgi:hypothetical protein
MPTRDAVGNRLHPDYNEVTWTGLLQGDDGSWFDAGVFADQTFQVTGTFGGATVAIQGSNEPTPSTGFTLTDQAGLGLSWTAAGGKVSAEAPRWVRPLVTGGDGTTSLTVRAVARR